MGGAECPLQSRRGGLRALAHIPRSQVFPLIMLISFQDFPFLYHQCKLFVYILE